ncbi:MAG: hypothetical protein ACFFD4_39340, partial [Candidatus Odinarchaeota archaeon]
MSEKIPAKRFILVPTYVYGGNIHIKEKEALQMFHKLVLRYIARNNNLVEVINAFGINPRIINDIIVYLLYNHLIILDLNNNYIDVTEEIAERIKEETLDEFLREKHTRTIPVEWVQERITGEIISGDYAKDYFISDQNIDPSEILDLRDMGTERITPFEKNSPTLLAKRVKLFLKSKISEEEGDILEQVERVADLHLIKNQPLYIPIKQKNVENGRTKLYFLDSPDLPDNIVEKLTNKLNHEIVDFASDYLEPLIDPLVQYTFRGINGHWQEIFSEINKLTRKNIKKQEQIDLVRNILEKLENEKHLYSDILRDHLTSLNTVNTRDFKGKEIINELIKAVEAAEEFVIVGSAFLSTIGEQSLKSLFTKAISKSLRIFLIWGLADLEDTDEQTRKTEEYKQLSANIPDEDQLIQIHASKKLFHSKFVVIDGKSAWITSCNLLNTDFESDTIEANAWIDGGKVPITLLEYAMDKISTSSSDYDWLESKLDVLKKNYNSTLDEERRKTLETVDKQYQVLLTSLKSFIAEYSNKTRDNLIQIAT